MDLGLYYATLLFVLCLQPFFWYGASALILLPLLPLALGLWNLHNRAPRHDLPGPGFYLGIGPILSYVRFLWTGIGEATNYYSRTYGSVCLVWIDWKETIIFSKSDAILQILKSQNYAARFASEPALQLLAMYRRGLIFSEGKIWDTAHKYFATALSGPYLVRSKELCVICTTKHLDLLEVGVDVGVNVEVVILLRCIAVDMFNQLYLRVEFNEKDLVLKIQNYMDAFQSLLIKPGCFFKVGWFYKKQQTAIQQLQDAIESLVEKKRQIVFSSEETEFDDFTSKLIKAQERGELTADDVRQCVLEMMIAAPDTVSTSVYFMLMLLNEHPEVEQQVLAEIDKIEQKGDQTAAERANEQKPEVLENFIKEALRFKPVIDFSMRRKLEHDEVLIEGIKVAKGTNVILNIGQMLKTRSFFPKPDEFSLDNFDKKGKKKKDQQDCFWPFSTGTRKCPGEFIAKIMLRSILVTLLSRYTMTPPDGCTLNNIGLTHNVTNQPPRGMTMTFYPRSKPKVNTQRTEE